MLSQSIQFRCICLLLFLSLSNVLARTHTYSKIRVDDQFGIAWESFGNGNEALCSMKCIWTECPGFKWDNNACFILAPNQILSIATQLTGTFHIFIREELIQEVESVVVYNENTFYEFIPETSPLHGLPMKFLDPPYDQDRILMDFPWGFHLCYIIQRSCYRWYFGTDEWIPMPNLNFPHVAVRDMIRINRTWWIFAGFTNFEQIHNNTGPHLKTESMDEDGHWHQGPPYLYRYYEGLAKISDTAVLAVGGSYNSIRNSDVATEFSLDGNKRHLFSLPCEMIGTTCTDYVTSNGTKVNLCLGGSCPPTPTSTTTTIFRTEVFIYNQETHDFITMPDWEFPEPIQFSNLAWFQGDLYVVGARYSQSGWNTIFKFNETQQPAWISIDMLPPNPLEYSRVRTFTRSLAVM